MWVLESAYDMTQKIEAERSHGGAAGRGAETLLRRR